MGSLPLHAGGVYADTDTLCLKPIDSWTQGYVSRAWWGKRGITVARKRAATCRHCGIRGKGSVQLRAGSGADEHRICPCTPWDVGPRSERHRGRGGGRGRHPGLVAALGPAAAVLPVGLRGRARAPAVGACGVQVGGWVGGRGRPACRQSAAWTPQGGGRGANWTAGHSSRATPPPAPRAPPPAPYRHTGSLSCWRRSGGAAALSTWTT